HLRIDDDPEHADRQHPHQLIAERRAGRHVEDEVADIDEAADRGEDAERDPEDLVHGQFPARLRARSTSAPTARSLGWSCSRCSTRARAAASCYFLRTRCSSPGTVLRTVSAWARFDVWMR